MTEPIVNRVAKSPLITLDLQKYLNSSVTGFDIKDWLFKGLILKESEFLSLLEELNFETYKNAIVALHCSEPKAIIPQWAFMKITAAFAQNEIEVHFGNVPQVKRKLLIETIHSIDIEEFRNKKMIIKGCGDPLIDSEAYSLITQKLVPVVQSLMYGEPCSTVPIYKKPKA